MGPTVLVLRAAKGVEATADIFLGCFGAIAEFSLLFACIAFSLATNVTFARCSRTFGNGS